MITEGTEGFVSVKTKEGNQVANVRQYALLRERQDADYREFQQPEEPADGVDEMEEQRREAASTARKEATRPAQGSAMEIDHAQLLLESDAVPGRQGTESSTSG